MARGWQAFRALRNRDFSLFWSSYFISNVGSWMQGVAQGWLLFDLTGSPLFLGLFSLLRMAMLLCFFLVGGLIADRWDRRRVMIWIQVVSLLTALGLAVLTSLGMVQVWHIFTLGALTSTAWAFEQPVRQSLIPQLVSREDLVNALALNAVTWHGAGLIGPSLVGFLVGWIGIAGCFYVNVISYLTIIMAFGWIRIPPHASQKERMGMTESLVDGLAYIRGQRLILTLLIGSSFFSIFGRSYITLLPVVAKDVLQVGASGLGFISAAPGLGTIIGSLGLAALGRVNVDKRFLAAVLLACAAALFLFAVSERFAAAFTMLVVVGGLSTVFDTLLHTLIQLNVADAYRGRVFGVYGLTAAGMREFGGMQAGFLAEWASAPFALESGAVIVAIVALFFLAPRLRQLGES